jgi:ankyrin repeat protein
MTSTAKSVHRFMCRRSQPGRFAQYFADHPKEVHAVNKKGETPLFSAAKCGSLAIVNYLLKCGAELTAKSNEGLIGHKNKFKFVVNIQLYVGQCVLHTAAQRGHLSLVHFFFLKGIGMDVKDTKGNLLLIIKY